ncbi:alpha/beta hydrolase [Gryllotalpicola koreensis]|uniref:Alpha/beta hydrolase-fold protein n=1 Tax=Gryllotalpicola koreensis TaxID=993086 RepID=A0ABP8A6D7_9MICO
MLHGLLALRITGGAFLIVVDALAVAAGLVLISRRPTRRWLLTVAAAAAGGLGFGYLLCWFVGDKLDLLGFSPTPISRMWVALLTAGIALVVVNVTARPTWRRMAAIGCLPLILLAGAVGINVDAGAFTHLGQALGVPTRVLARAAQLPHRAATGAAPVAADWRADGALPGKGRLYRVSIPGRVSHFQARDAEIYLPPAALAKNAPTLPVIFGFSGQPGSPSDLFELGHLDSYLNAYARAHHGVAPIVVVPDQLGAQHGRNPMCVDSPLGNVASYVKTDVAGWVRAHLNVESSPSGWGLLGFSEGATCANQFLAGDPGQFSAELSISSELAPWNGPSTVAEAFHGSAAAYAAASPESLLRHGAPYRHAFAEFAVGANDARYRSNAVALDAAAKAAGMTTTLTISPGSAHDWNTVRYALSHDLAPLVEHLGESA